MYIDCWDYDFSCFKKVLEKVMECIFDIELERGEVCIDVILLVWKLDGVIGVELMICLLSLMGKEKFIWFDKWYYDIGESCIGMFCYLMLYCVFLLIDMLDWLKMFVEWVGIILKCLVEMVVYFFCWLEMVEEVIGWKGLICVVNLFYVYIRECYDDVDEVRIMFYIFLLFLEILVGVVDMVWFWKVYNVLGCECYEKVFVVFKVVMEFFGVYSCFWKYMDVFVGKYMIV